VNSNSLLIIGDSDVVVVDAQFTRLATLETIAVIRHLTRGRSGGDQYALARRSRGGNQVYRDSFPGVRFVMQANTAVDFATLGASNRTGTVQGAPPVADRYARLLDMGLESTARRYLKRASFSLECAPHHPPVRRRSAGSGPSRPTTPWTSG